MTLPNKAVLHIVILVIVCLALFLPGSLLRGLWTPDETRYAAISKGMVDSGDWLTLRINGQIYTQKPPVFFWAISFFGLLSGGVNDLAARLVSILSGTGTVVATYLFAKKLFNGNAALISGLVLSTAIAFFAASQMVMLDALFTFLAVSALYLLYTGISKAGRIRGICYFAAFILMALATLTKGPVGVILPVLAISAYALFTKQMRSLLSWGTALGFLAFLAIIASWLVPACVRGGEEYTRELLGKQIFGRYFEAFDHKEPLLYYLYAFPAGFLPWAVFLPAAISLLAKDRKDNRIKLLAAWPLSILLFFTLSSSKNILYTLPVYPAAAMAIGYYWDKKRRPLRQVFVLIAAIFALSVSISLFVIPHIDRLKSPKYFGSRIAKHIGPDSKLSAYLIKPVYWVYYSGRNQMDEFHDYDKLDKYLSSPERVFCIIELNIYREYISANKNHGYLIDYEAYRSKNALGLISNRIR
ncbi:MAG: glycosyltransferase family 39 protein [Candidatus Omnitrophota bacterium]